MKKIIFGVFAHPDDETFGPVGTLLTETQKGTELHLITLTDGGAGMNPDGHKNLGKVRLGEWKAAGRLIGAQTMEFFNYIDGELNNKAMIEISTRLIEYVTSIIALEPSDTIIEFMTLDMNGLTGHIDHIVAARATCLAFYKLKSRDGRINRIRFSCIPHILSPTFNTDWIYAEEGHLPEEITEIIDARDKRERILEVIKTHHTQRSDGEMFINTQGDQLGLNYFIIKA